MSRIKPMYDGIKLNIAITSDNHIDKNSKENRKRMKIVKEVLKDVERSEVRFDAYITVGDTTSRGLNKNWKAVKKCFRKVNPADRILFTLGNHDSWSKKGFEGYSDGIKNFYKYSKEICNNDIEKPYFSKIIKGYHLIFLGTDEVPENEDCAAFSKAQIRWFGDEMKKAKESENPVFVFCHQSVNAHHGLPKTWSEKEDPSWGIEIGGIGKDSDTIEKILKKYKNVYYFSGHSHMGLCGEDSKRSRGYASFEEHDGVNYINLPCLTRLNHHGGNEKSGQGLILEVYNDKVVIRPRDFLKKEMNKDIEIKKGKPYLKEKII